MNPQTAAQCRTLMFDHLKSKGYPEMTDQQIFDELPAMHAKLLADKLTPSSFTLESFKQIATATCQNTRFMEMMRAQMGHPGL